MRFFAKKIGQKFLLIGWMGGWVGGLVCSWMEIIYPLRFSSNSSMLTSKICWFQILCLKLAAAFLSEVMSISIFKIRKFKGRHKWENEGKIWFWSKSCSACSARRDGAKPPMQAQFSKFEDNSRCTSLPFPPLGVDRKPYTTECRRREFTDGWERWMGWGIKSVFLKSSYFVGI